MKLLHLSDLHLGKTLGDYSLIDDQKYGLDQVLELIGEHEVDAILIAGDVYDRSMPSEAAVGLLDDFLSELAARKIRTFMISGNHDSDSRLEYGSRLFANKDIHITAVFDGKLAKQIVKDDFGEVNIYMLPFVKASQVRHYYPESKIDNYEDAVRTVIEHADIDSDARNILIAHQFVSGKTGPVLAGSESTSVQNVGTIEVISSDLFKEFDYVALGHLHSPQEVGYDYIRYSGSLLKYSLAEALNPKSVPLICLNEKGSMSVELLPLIPRRDLRHITGQLEQLLQPENIHNPDDYIYITLTDEDIITDVMGIVRQHYPNTVKIDYNNSHTKEIENFEVGEVTVERPFKEIIEDFYQKMYGMEISDEEMKVMMSVAEEAGVVNEAD